MYAFTNRFSGPGLRQRVGMMNGQRSSLLACWRYGIVFLATLGVTVACQIDTNKLLHKYSYQSGNVFYGVITHRASDSNLDTLLQELNQRDIKVEIKKLVRLADGRINQIALAISPPEPGHPIDTEIGSSLGESSIPAIGLRCDEAGCQLSSVDDRFPRPLVDLAIEEDDAPELQHLTNAYNDANAVFGMYRVFFRNDFLESNYFGYRHTAVRVTPDYHLDLYPEFKQAIIFIDGKEVSTRELATFSVLDLKKVVVFKGDAAVLRLGNNRARNGLILLYKLHNISIRDKYAATRLLEIAYPQLFAQP